MKAGDRIKWKLAGRGAGRIANGTLLGRVLNGQDPVDVAGKIAENHTIAFPRKDNVRDFDRYMISVPTTGKKGDGKPKVVLARLSQVVE